MHNCGIRTRNLVHTFRSHYHYAASVNTSVLQMSVIRVIFNRPCSPRSRHLAAGVGHTARDQPQRQPRPWHCRPGPPRGNPSPGVPKARWHPLAGSFEAAGGSAAWLKPGWGTFAGCCWPVGQSKCSEHIAWVRRGHSRPATGPRQATGSFIRSWPSVLAARVMWVPSQTAGLVSTSYKTRFDAIANRIKLLVWAGS